MGKLFDNVLMWTMIGIGFVSVIEAGHIMMEVARVIK